MRASLFIMNTAIPAVQREKGVGECVRWKRSVIFPGQRRIPNPENSPVASPHPVTTSSTRIPGSSRAYRRRMNSLRSGSAPSATTSTVPSARFFAYPVTPISRARSVTKYRYPTPWTRPDTFAVIRFILRELKYADLMVSGYLGLRGAHLRFEAV
jgi:hypothetical protein